MIPTPIKVVRMVNDGGWFVWIHNEAFGIVWDDEDRNWWKCYG